MSLKSGIGLLFLIHFIAIGCQEKAPSIIMDQERFTSVLTEIQLLDASFRQNVIKEDYPNQKLPSYYEQVFKRHGIDKMQFDSTYNYYSRQPEVMMEIHTEIRNRLTMEEDMYKKAQEGVLE